MNLLRPNGDVIERVPVEDVWRVLPTFVCKCGWIGGINDANQIYCDNRKCEYYGKLFAVSVITTEIKEHAV